MKITARFSYLANSITSQKYQRNIDFNLECHENLKAQKDMGSKTKSGTSPQVFNLKAYDSFCAHKIRGMADHWRLSVVQAISPA